jgi:peptidoglycan hydrolase-like protein with peptidoglycan-binding domain
MIARTVLRFVAVCVICSGTVAAAAVPANAATSTSASTNATGVYNVGACHFVGQLLTIRLNASGSLVRFLQCLLVANHIPLPDGIDGYFGTHTQSAVIKYQSDNHIQVDGIVGPQTWATFVS